VSTPEEIRSSLQDQVTGTVRWTETIEHLIDREGCDLFIELGPGGVLSGLLQRIRRGTPASASPIARASQQHRPCSSRTLKVLRGLAADQSCRCGARNSECPRLLRRECFAEPASGQTSRRCEVARGCNLARVGNSIDDRLEVERLDACPSNADRSLRSGPGSSTSARLFAFKTAAVSKIRERSVVSPGFTS
jgi:hypothetical protein